MERPPLSSSTASLKWAARALAEAFTAGPWVLDELVARGGLALGRRGRWLRPLAARVLSHFGDGSRPPAVRVAQFLLEDPKFRRACRRLVARANVAAWPSPAMWPAPGAPQSWGVPEITTVGALAELLALAPNDLDWFADCQSRLRVAASAALEHYLYSWRTKPGGLARLIEAPKARLKALQRQVLAQVLDPIPPHASAHGFRRGRSVASFATPHVGMRVVLAMDLCDFFPSVSAARVRALFHTVGYPEPVARVLTGLCTTAAPRRLWNHPECPLRGPEFWRARRRLSDPHLPQGAPTSPALANLCAYRLDVRLSTLAESAGARYTRYADDLVFSGSGDFERSLRRFPIHAAAIALEEGFAVNTRKTRVMRQGVRQRIAGLVVNQRPNIARVDYDTLKATLHNCVRHGPASQNREAHADFRAHLAGRISHVASLNPKRGERLRAIFERIAW